MPTREITLVLTMNREPTIEEIKAMGRDAAQMLLTTSGTYASYPHRSLVSSVRHATNEWDSARYLGPAESRDWAVTESEIEEWDQREREEEYDEDDEW